MPIYTCPECGAKLKKNKELEPGKKLKCSECEVIFAIPGQKPKKPATPSVPLEDEDGPMQYTVVTDPNDEAAEKIRKSAFDPTAERFEKSKRGPALDLVVKPSNTLLASGVGTCLAALATALFAIFPLIFKVEDVSNQKQSLYTRPGDNKTKYIELTDEEKTTRYWMIAASVGYFLWGSVVCMGASKMHELETYWLAMTGAVMGLAGPGLTFAAKLTSMAMESGEIDMAYFGPAVLLYAAGLPPGIWTIVTLRKQAVLDGFAEEAPE